MKFGEAIEAVKAGKRAWRIGWNGIQAGKTMHIVLIRVTQFASAPLIGDWQNCSPCIALVTGKTLQPGWLASQPDMLSEDWEIGE